jgi:hypothetical protein
MTREPRHTPQPRGGDPALSDAATGAHVPTDEDAIRALVGRLSRPHPSGGRVIERAAILAAGPDSAAMLAWTVAHGHAEEEVAPRGASRGLYGGGLTARPSTSRRQPLRYVLPAGAL